MFKLLHAIDDPETGKTIHRYTIAGGETIEIITDLGEVPSDFMVLAQVNARKQERLARDRAKANESVKRSYRLKKT